MKKVLGSLLILANIVNTLWLPSRLVLATCREFEALLAKETRDGRINREYPHLCAEVTAKFAVLSETINSIRQAWTIESPSSTIACSPQVNHEKRRELVSLANSLQAMEREKLHHTAALHLETVRLAINQDDAADAVWHDESRRAALLNESVQQLRSSIGKIEESINEVLDELKVVMMEESD
jgi:DNA repair REX1-B